ncbi:hypothetical protein [Herbiconiux sp. YIM B11900]|uniref:hypothetical protein n=1 Tax=Herbiconiux sp. YIM B11900 TaxID=3404131 RepID=UPI003F867F5F
MMTVTPFRRRASRRRRMIVQVVIGLVAAAILLAGLTWYSGHRVWVDDQISIWTRPATVEATSLADATALSDEGRFLYLASAPTVQGQEEFQRSCELPELGGHVLGCYDGRSIFVLDVLDQRLAGVREVTAAHEMLHAAFVRLSDDERRTLDPLLRAEWEKKQADPVFLERMGSYGELEGRSLLTELHSIFATEVAELDPALEAYYGRYFTDRSVVVGLNAAYEGVLAEVNGQAERLAAELTALGDSLDAQSSAFRADSETLAADIGAYNADAEAGIGGYSELTERRDELQARSDELDARYDGLEPQYTHYDELRAQLEQLDAQAAELDRSLDGTLPPPPS